MLALLMILAAAPDPAAAKKGPPPSELARLYFLAGDLRRAVESAGMGRQDPKKPDAAACKTLYPLLVEYEFLVPRRDTLKPEEAKSLLELDREISPKQMGNLTKEVLKHYVEIPLQLARNAGSENAPRARKLLAQVLAVDPANPDALKLSAELGPADAGSH
jgi:hypothetical protein